MDVKVERTSYRFNSCLRTLFYCARERAYYVLSTTTRGESLVFPCRSVGTVITHSEVFECKADPELSTQGTQHLAACCAFMREDPKKVRARLERNNELGG